MIEVRPERVAQRLKIDYETYKDTIKSVIDDMVPFISSKIDDEYLNSDDPNIKAILNLGVTEIIMGTVMKELFCTSDMEGDSASFKIGIVSIEEDKSSTGNLRIANNWEESGWGKLKDYLKPIDSFCFITR